VHLGTLGLVLEPMASTLAALVDELPDDVLLFVDPNCRPTIIPDPAAYQARLARILERADVVKVSADDLVFLRPGQSALDGARWVRSLGRAAVLHTDGAAAVTVLAGAGEPRTVGVPPVRVVDTVGAGDTFGGAALASIVHDGVARGALDESAVLRAAELGVRAASIACTRAGADPPTLAELGGW
jgi:fructokinase